MDSLISAAAHGLAVGDPLTALNLIALRDDPPALALRGIAMAQLGDLDRAKILLRRAARAFGPKEAVARARCIVAEAEVALASRDLAWPIHALDAARLTLEQHGDHVNAAHARHLQVRRLLLIGRLDEAERALDGIDSSPLPPALRTVHELVIAGIAMRRLRTKPAREALARAGLAVHRARIPALAAEVENASRLLTTPAARLIADGKERPLLLEEVEALQASKAFVVDACRNVVRNGSTMISLATRPVLFTLARSLAEAWPGDVSRDALVARAFRARRADEFRIARGCASRWDGSAPCCANSPMSPRPNRGLRCSPSVPARWSCWRGRSRKNTPRFSHFSPTASHGRARRWPWRSAPASAPCSGRSTSLHPTARCNGSAVAGRGAG